MFTVLKIFDVPKIYKNYKNIFLYCRLLKKELPFFYTVDFAEEGKAVLNLMEF